MTHDKQHLPKATILSRTRYVGFNREPVNDTTRSNTVNSLTPAASTYKLRDGRRWIDGETR